MGGEQAKLTALQLTQADLAHVRGPVGERLVRDGHIVVTVRSVMPSAVDPDVLRLARSRGGLLLTEDKDFGKPVYRRGMDDVPVVLLRLAGLLVETKADLVSNVRATRAEELMRWFTIIEPATIWIRPLRRRESQP